MRRAWVLFLVFAAAATGADAALRALRDVRGVVKEVTVEARAGGEPWTVVVVRTEDGEVERLGLASGAVLDAERFRLEVGDAVRARFFTDGEPHEVQRLRNETNGRVLRLRCLHGDPLRSHHRRGK